MSPTATTRRARPKVTLTREAVVAGAIDLADTDGLAAVTMSRLAASLGVTTMALYWHFKDKDELLQGMGGRLFADIALPPLAGDSWDAEIRVALRALVDSLGRHPAVAGLALTTVLSSEAGLTLSERILGQLRRGGFAPEEAAQIGIFLLGSVVTLVTTEPGPDASVPAELQEDHKRQKRAMLHALPPEKFPSVIELADALADCDDSAAYLDRGVSLLVGGLLSLSATG